MKNILPHILISILFFLEAPTSTFAQNSLLGDGFGGREWYKSYNYSVGSYSAYTVCGDSDQLYAWGGNFKYELGDGTNVSRIFPDKVKGMTNVKYYTAGYYSAAIKSDSSGWVWGNQGKFRQGPVKIVDNAKYACAGSYFTSFVLSNGKVVSTGVNTNGVFGNADVGNWFHDTAVVMDDMNSAVRVSNTSSAQIILTNKGTVYSVGVGYQGALGLGDSVISVAKPRRIPNLSGIVDVKSTALNTIALNQDGEVYTWGQVLDSAGSKAIYTPEKIAGLKNIIAISAKNDGFHSLFLDKDSNCFALGYNSYYQLGTGNDTNQFKPKLVAKGIVEIMAAETFSFVVNGNGELMAAGKRDYFGNVPWFDSSINDYKTFSKINLPTKPFPLCTPKIAQLADSMNITLCYGDSFLFDGQYRKDSGYYHKTEMVDGVLDTNRVLHLSIHSLSYGEAVWVELCEGEQFVIERDKYDVKDSLIFIHTNRFGCDSIVTYHFTRNQKTRVEKHIMLCEGEKFELNGESYIVNDSLVYQYERPNKCDSIVTYIFTRKPKVRVVKGVNICPGELFYAQGKYHQTNQSLILNYSRPGNCDSIVTYAFTILAYQFDTVILEKCPNQIVQYRNRSFQNIGLFYDTFSNTSGCDSVIAIKVVNSNSFRCYPVGLSLPNTFTPNNDGYNDVFEPFGNNLSGIVSEMKIFTRWGALVYQNDPLIEPWNGTINGTKASEGTYFYHFTFSINGAKSTVVYGVVNLLR